MKEAESGSQDRVSSTIRPKLSSLVLSALIMSIHLRHLNSINLLSFQPLSSVFSHCLSDSYHLSSVSSASYIRSTW